MKHISPKSCFAASDKESIGKVRCGGLQWEFDTRRLITQSDLVERIADNGAVKMFTHLAHGIQHWILNLVKLESYF
jgi:hypothetical protein